MIELNFDTKENILNRTRKEQNRQQKEILEKYLCVKYEQYCAAVLLTNFAGVHIQNN